MPKNIILLSDGTGNSSAKAFKTNVWRLFQILDLSDPASQIAFYDNGVGTSSFKPLAVLGEVFGIGLKRNVIDIYSFCCRNYQAGDRIYCFGFSRGAFTIRIVAGMIAREGLVKYNDDEAELVAFAADAYRLYRRRFTGGIVTFLKYFLKLDVREIRDRAIRLWRRLRGRPVRASGINTVDSIHFVGLWDTVDAYGGPIEEMTRAIDYWVWPLSMPDQFMNAKIHKACHAMALEDERDAFTPAIWDQRYVRGIDKNYNGANGRDPQKDDWLFDINYHAPSVSGRPLDTPPDQRVDLPAIDRERISQVWFTGVHADIGGGYPQDGLSFVTLDWMMDRATAYGLKLFNLQRRLLLTPQIAPYDKLNDSRQGLGGYYRYKPRNLLELYNAPPYKPSFLRDLGRIRILFSGKPDPQTEVAADLHSSVVPGGVRLPPPATVHTAVFDRITSGDDRYAPVVLPANYKLTDKAGGSVNGPHSSDKRPWRSQIQDDAWNWIWLRRIVYFLTVFASFFVAAIPYFVTYYPDFGKDTAVGRDIVIPVVDGAASFLPGFLKPWFDAFRDAPGLLLAGVIAVAALLYAGGYLQEKIRDVMRFGWHPPTVQIVPARNWWRRFAYWLRRRGTYRAGFYILKNWIFPTGIIFWLFWWFLFGTANTLGLICKGKGGVEVTEIETNAKSSGGAVFQTLDVCYATGLKVTHEENYDIKLVVTEPWLDDTIPTDPTGFRKSSWAQLFGVPFKRLIWSKWFVPIVRVGSYGLEEHLPDFQPDGNGGWIAHNFTPRSDGEVFVYVNDTSIFLPWLFTHFYNNNHGSAVVSLKKTS
jgi:uncharacterized protein (DUF2235 family)